MGQKVATIAFLQKVIGPFGMLKQVFLATFEAVVTRLGPGKYQTSLKMGHFGTHDGSKKGQKRIFAKVMMYHLGCPNKCFSPVLSRW